VGFSLSDPPFNTVGVQEGPDISKKELCRQETIFVGVFVVNILPEQGWFIL
jgi:hypothetical protein